MPAFWPDPPPKYSDRDIAWLLPEWGEDNAGEFVLDAKAAKGFRERLKEGYPRWKKKVYQESVPRH